MKRKITALILALCLVISMAFVLGSCGGGGGEGGPAGSTGDGSATAYVNLDINPEISLILDSNGLVISAIAENEDAQILLYEEEGIVGATLDVAIDKVLTLAVELGFISEDNKVIGTVVSAENEEKSEALLQSITASINAKSDKLGVSVSVNTDGAHSLIRSLKDFKEAHKDDPKISALTPADFKLMLEVAEEEGVDIEVVVDYERDELVGRLKTASDKAEKFATKVFEETVKQAEAAYKQTVKHALSATYFSYFTEKGVISKLPVASLYQAYVLAASSLDFIAATLDRIEDADDHPLDDELVAQVAELVGLDEEQIEKLENREGDITLDSIEEYLDRYLKNLDDDRAEELEDELDDLLDSIEETIEESLKELNAEHGDEIEAAIETVYLTLSAFESILPAELLAPFGQAMDDVAQLIEEGEIDSDSIEDIAEDLEDAAEEVEEHILEELTDEQKEEIEAKKKKIMDTLGESKTKLDNAIKDAVDAAKKHLGELKQSLKGGKR